MASAEMGQNRPNCLQPGGLGCVLTRFHVPLPMPSAQNTLERVCSANKYGGLRGRDWWQDFRVDYFWGCDAQRIFDLTQLSRDVSSRQFFE